MSLAEDIELACLIEATAPKPGNVHPQAAFRDLCYNDFVLAARAIADPLSLAGSVGLGTSILNSIRAVRDATGTNVNLGIVLLLAPLVAVPPSQSLKSGIASVLRQTTIDDAAQVYQAIRLAAPGGMGEVSAQDIRERPTVTLYEAMTLAADRDRIAEQYANHYAIVFAACDRLREMMNESSDWQASIVKLELWIMSQWPDTLIMRKCGRALAEEAAAKAAAVLAVSESDPEQLPRALVQFDAWLRADGHRRNPGTTADLIAATLFAARRDGLIKLPTLAEVRRAANSALTFLQTPEIQQ